LSHLHEEVKLFLADHPTIILDCEVYAHVIYGTAEYMEKKKKFIYTPPDPDDPDPPELDTSQKFDIISGAVRPTRNTPHALEEQMCLYIFDIADPTGLLDQDERFDILKELFKSPLVTDGSVPHIKLVPTKTIYYIEEVEEIHGEMAYEGYEGVVLRARELLYESHKNSLMMRKYKHFVDKEFVVIDAVCDEGVDRESFTWVCEVIIPNVDTGESSLESFNVKPMGTRDQRREWYDNYEQYIGELLTVIYQPTAFDEDGEPVVEIPRFPRGKAIRNYE
jgi:hypothetical protein